MRRSVPPRSRPDLPDDDAGRFTRLYEERYARLLRFASRYVRDRAEAEDVVHDAFLRLWSRRREWADAGAIDGYLYLAVRGEAIDRLRRARREQRLEEGAERGAPAVVVDDLMREELAGAIQRAMDDLPPRARQVLRMRWLEERPNADVARMLGLSVKTVEMHVTRALAALRGRLARS
ncbi:MAG TPA: RNA polymerase sigma-70 factor [Gemmatimonadaceae bacterium]|nr:RNA polymerase sigma-70 factor [Gemmatimonadaceae bacterium]